MNGPGGAIALCKSLKEKVMNLFIKSVLGIALALAAFQASAHGNEKDHKRDHKDRKKVCSTSQSTTTSAPANYHALYASIESTIVTIKDVYLRTADGQAIKIPGAAREVDLQDLNGLGKGILIH